MTVHKPFWSIHTHSRYSANDAMPSPAAIVARGVELGYPAIGLTDHGNVSGSVQLYKAARKAGIEPLPGIELYMTSDIERKLQGKEHLTVVAYSEVGYRNLVHLNNMAAQHFFYKPTIDLALLAEMSDAGRLKGLAVGTGCFFGIVVQRLVQTGDPALAKQVVLALTSLFDRTYVELQHHGIEKHEGSVYSESEIADELINIAHEAGVPYILAQDSHYIYPEEQELHDAFKTMASFSDDADGARFPGGPYSMVDRDYFAGRLPDLVVERSLDALGDLAGAAHVRLPELESFRMLVPEISKSADPFQDLKARVNRALADRYATSTARQRSDAQARLNDEFDTIEAGETAGYLMLVAYVCDFMVDKGIWFHARGSASGSFVCFLLGITQVDPIEWGLRMDRFMSPDRTRPPDIDLDVERERREEVITWLGERFAVRQVGSHMQLGLDDEDEGPEFSDEPRRGSLLVKYLSVAHKKGYKDFKPRDIPKEDWELLDRLAKMKLISGSGTHAAGYIVAPDPGAVAQLPLTWMTNRKAYVTSYGKKDVEALGFLKLDLLGLRTLTAIRIACEQICPEDPKGFWERIPKKDTKALQRIARGDTEGMFQLEGKAMTYGSKELGPRSLQDIVASVALFRPALMKNKEHQVFMRRRAKAEKIPERHPDIQMLTAETYGTLLYQEQIIALLRMAGMTAEELTDLLDAVKASNADVGKAGEFLEAIKPRMRELFGVRGWTDADIDWFLDGLLGYADYSFNKAHAAAYGVVAYRTAYLITHHPLEYWHGLLVAFQGAKSGKKDKEADYVRAARNKYGVQVLPAHVNKSGATYVIDRARKAIRKGLISVKGVGPVASQELAAHQPYASLADLGQKVIHQKVSGAKGLALKKLPDECGGVVKALYDAAALDGLEAS